MRCCCHWASAVQQDGTDPGGVGAQVCSSWNRPVLDMDAGKIPIGKRLGRLGAVDVDLTFSLL
jgi:hypothetical protein